MDNNTIIACNNVPLDVISYQEVVTMVDNDSYLSNVNILLGEKITRKIRFQPGEKPYVKGMGKAIAIQYLDEALGSKNKRKTKSSEKQEKNKIKPEAANKAAKDLFTELGL